MKIVFVSYEQNNFNISIIDIHGKNYETLTYGDHPQFSPDGSKIVFVSVNPIHPCLNTVDRPYTVGMTPIDPFQHFLFFYLKQNYQF